MNENDPSGIWKAEWETPIGLTAYTFHLKAGEGKITGKAVRLLEGEELETELREGRIENGEIHFAELIYVDDRQIWIEYNGKIEGGQLKLTRQVADFDTREITATRQPAPAGQAEFEGI